jgi:hypothetical protein
MTDQIAPPDLAVPPNPFNHGPCRWKDCPFPAVFEGGGCAMHVAMIAAANVASGYDAMGTAKRPARTTARTKAKRRAANASRRRNR